MFFNVKCFLVDFRGAILLGIESAPLSEDEDEDENSQYYAYHNYEDCS